MKIAILSFYSGHLERGVESWTHEMAHRLSKNGHEVTVMQGGPKPRKRKQYRVETSDSHIDEKKNVGMFNGWKRVYLDYYSRLVARSTFYFLPQILLGKYDIVIPTNNGWQAFLVRVATWFSSSRMIVVNHTGVGGWDERLNLLMFPDAYIALSQKALQIAKHTNPFVKSLVIPNGVDTKAFHPKGKRAKIGLKHPLIISVAALSKEKGISTVVEAVSHIPHAHLLVLGKGGEEENVRKLAKKKKLKDFELKDVAYEEIPDYYRSADVFVLTAWNRNAFGLVYLEAMASGLPVIATDDPIRRDIIGDAGILVDPEKPDEIAHAIQKALDTEWGEKPRKQAEKFAWENIVKKYEKLFRKLIDE